jgi:hypothetical protein
MRGLPAIFLAGLHFQRSPQFGIGCGDSVDHQPRSDMMLPRRSIPSRRMRRRYCCRGSRVYLCDETNLKSITDVWKPARSDLPAELRAAADLLFNV